MRHIARAGCALIAALSLHGCDSGDGHGDDMPLSDGLKIFVTTEEHVSDFANDPTLAGANAIEKADSFCNRSARKPNDSVYKALLVDGVNRDAASRTAWVLLPNTTYYRTHGNIVIDTTNASAIFDAYWRPMQNSVVHNCDRECQSHWSQSVWTGIGDARSFSTGASTCNGWSDAVFPEGGHMGYFMFDDGAAFSSPGSGGCGNYTAPVYCVEQPE